MAFFKTTYTFEVLSDGLLPDSMSLKDIDYETMEGHCSGHFLDTKVEKLTREELIEACHEHGTDPDFFLMEEDEDAYP